jgi:hypothetical protein
MAFNEQLAELVAWAQAEAHRWAGSLSTEERAAAGRADAWGARDLLVHFAEWGAVSREQMAARVAGRELPKLPDDDEINQVFFERNQALSWVETVAKFDAAYDALQAQLRSMSDEALRRAEPPENGRPVWFDIAFGTADHLARHLAENYAIRGDGDAADALILASSERLAALDDSPRYSGLIPYNLACHHALRGRREQALDTLRRALAIRPDMAGYAGQDPDFTSLRDDPAFQALARGE